MLACHTIHRADVQRSDTPASRRTGHELPEDRRGVHPQIVTISVDTSCKPTSSAIRTRVGPASKPSACQARPAVPSPKKTRHFWVSLASSGQAGISKAVTFFTGPEQQHRNRSELSSRHLGRSSHRKDHSYVPCAPWWLCRNIHRVDKRRNSIVATITQETPRRTTGARNGRDIGHRSGGRRWRWPETAPR